MLSKEAQLHIDADLSEPRDAEAAAGFAAWSRFQPPTPGYSEQVFHHKPSAGINGECCIELSNPAVGLGLRWTYAQSSLPHLFQWKMMGEGAYVLGIEPANCRVGGRAVERERGALVELEPGGSREYRLAVEVTPE